MLQNFRRVLLGAVSDCLPAQKHPLPQKPRPRPWLTGPLPKTSNVAGIEGVLCGGHKRQSSSPQPLYPRESHNNIRDMQYHIANKVLNISCWVRCVTFLNILRSVPMLGPSPNPSHIQPVRDLKMSQLSSGAPRPEAISSGREAEILPVSIENQGHSQFVRHSTILSCTGLFL